MDRINQRQLFDVIAPYRDAWKRRNWYYNEQLRDLVSSMVLPNSTILEVGCGTGDLLGHLRPVRGVGIDISEEIIRIARQKHPSIDFYVGDAEALPVSGTFDYRLMRLTPVSPLCSLCGCGRLSEDADGIRATLCH